MLSALLRTLDLRDRMTARHSAAVARYAREIAIAAGFSKEEQELVHTAGLLHDIGKFIFPDRILKGDTKLNDDDWKIIKMHPYQGARVVAQMEGYGPISEIILAHHERIDGKGYPRGLRGTEIPALSRIISVADTYDVMTARDSYRTPISSFEAIQELRRVSGAQLDGEFVELFIRILAGKDVRFRHGEDADFDAELGLDKRVAEYSLPLAEVDGKPSEESVEIAERDAASARAAAARVAARPPASSCAARSGGTMFTDSPVPSSKPARRVSRGTTSMCQWKWSAPRGAVRTHRFSGGGAPSRLLSRSRPSHRSAATLARRRRSAARAGAGPAAARRDRARRRGRAAPRGRRSRRRARGGGPPPGAGRTAGSRPSCGRCAR